MSTKEKRKSDALKFLANFEAEKKKRDRLDIIPKTLREFRFEFLIYSERTHTEKTTKVYKTTFRYLLEYFENRPLHEISKLDIRTYLDYRLSKTSVFAARKDLINLKASFNYALEKKYVRENPCLGIKQFKIPEKQPLYLSKVEYEQLLKVIDEKPFRNLVAIAANTGLRQMELLNLTWKQINLENKTIILDNHQHLTKSKRVRSIPMNDTVYNILNRKSNIINPHSKVFGFEGRYIDSKISHRFKDYIKKANLNPKYHFHSLRHTFASWLVQSGVNIYIVSKLLGHANIQTTEIYSHLRRDDLQLAVNNI
ncbi:MAG: tyrosine-type recombinase/integrase [Bacteroidia bacterium]|nr:tyrosine-type recombinase/integrase [Bacteroidia bacterium]